MHARNLPAAETPANSFNRQSDANGPLLLDARIRSVHAAMRGRYGFAVVIGLLCGAAACAFGYTRGHITYRSTARIRVAPVRARVLYANDDSGSIPEYERFVETQMTLMTSAHVVEAAADDKLYKLAGGKDDADSFAANMTVEHENEIVTVSKTDTTPDAAMSGVQTVVEAYQRLYVAEDTNTDNRRLEILRQHQQQLTDDLAAKKAAMLAIGNKYGSPNIASLYDVKLDDYRQLQAETTRLKIQLSLASSEPAEVQPEDLVNVDPTLGALVQDRSKVQTQIAALLATGLQKEHPVVKSAQAQLDSIEGRIQDRLAQVAGSPEKLGSHVTAGGGRPLLSPTAIREQLDRLSRQFDQCEADLANLGRASLQVADLNSEMGSIQKNLDDTSSRISALGVESGMSSRITLLADADKPTAPFKDTRRLFATAGLFGGLTFGFGGVMMPLMLNRRLRSVEEMRLRLTGDQVLGMLPEMSPGQKAEDQKTIAAHAIHQIRSMLQIRNRLPNPVYVITSPASGSGKTSLAIGLAMSYASAGSRTLLIDCDLVGGGLTHRMEPLMRSQVGELLVGRGLITDVQLADARVLAKAEGLHLTEAILKRKFITADALDRELKNYHLRAPGVLRAVEGERFDSCVLDTEVANLSFIPRGGVWEQNASSLTPRNVRRLIEKARDRFDVVLIDSGPLPASLEASVVAAQADGTIVIVSRGESHKLVEACLSQLAAVDARLAGAVFNRADAPDLRHSAAYCSTPHPGALRLPDRRSSSASAVHDPIAHAVANSITAYEEDLLDDDSLAVD